MTREIFVSAPFYYTGNEGWLEAETRVIVGGSALIKNINRKTANHLAICTYMSSESPENIKKKISEGMKQAHQKAQEKMIEEFGDDWRCRATYKIGKLNYNEEAELSKAELDYLDS